MNKSISSMFHRCHLVAFLNSVDTLLPRVVFRERMIIALQILYFPIDLLITNNFRAKTVTSFSVKGEAEAEVEST